MLDEKTAAALEHGELLFAATSWLERRSTKRPIHC